ncbi:MAG: GTP 3',8-cyclase MoaA [Desulfatiglandaceae bacterium]
METEHPRLIDTYHRELDYLRISVTDRCNLRCRYCTPRQGLDKLEHEEILTYEEIMRVVALAVKMGVNKIRLTGGEPLVRKGIDNLLPCLTNFSELEDISLTTNGIYLSDHLEMIKASGIKRINISLDTLNPRTYEYITGFDGFHQVWTAIHRAADMGFYPIKLNTVVLKDINEKEVVELATLSKKYPFHIRFIEYMPGGFVDPDTQLCHVPNSTLKQRISKSGRLVPVPRVDLDGPTVRFKFEGAPGEIGFISPLTHHFCDTCNRLRLTANGRLRPCLFSDWEVDLKTPMREGADDAQLARMFIQAAENKPRSHRLASVKSTSLSGKMSAIGG